MNSFVPKWNWFEWSGTPCESNWADCCGICNSNFDSLCSRVPLNPRIFDPPEDFASAKYTNAKPILSGQLLDQGFYYCRGNLRACDSTRAFFQRLATSPIPCWKMALIWLRHFRQFGRENAKNEFIKILADSWSRWKNWAVVEIFVFSCFELLLSITIHDTW